MGRCIRSPAYDATSAERAFLLLVRLELAALAAQMAPATHAYKSRIRKVQRRRSRIWRWQRQATPHFGFYAARRRWRKFGRQIRKFLPNRYALLQGLSAIYLSNIYGPHLQHGLIPVPNYSSNYASALAGTDLCIDIHLEASIICTNFLLLPSKDSTRSLGNSQVAS